MATIAITDWYAWAAGVSLLVALAVLVFLAWWALFSDRPGDRRRCPHCWYDLSYSPGMTCTECGFEARTERDLRRIRRRTGLATLSILGCVTIGLFILDRANTRGWMTYLPTGLVLAAAPYADDPNGAVLSDLVRRIRGGELAREDWMTLLEQCLAGDAGAPLTSDAWIDKYARHLVTAESMAAKTDDQEWAATIERLLLDVPPRIRLDTRKVWPAGHAPTVDVFARSWWPRGTQWRIRAAPLLPGAKIDEHVLLDAPIQRRSYSLSLPRLGPGVHKVDVELTVSRRRDAGSDWETLAPIVVPVDCIVMDAPQAKLEPVTGADVDEVMRNVFGRGLAKFGRGSLPVRVNVDIRQSQTAILEDTAIGARIEVRRNGKLGRRLDMWWLAGGAPDGTSAWEVPWHDDEVLGAPLRDDEVWTIRARGDLELALRVQGATKYWAGEVDVEVPARFQGAHAPYRGWVVWEGDDAESGPKQ